MQVLTTKTRHRFTLGLALFAFAHPLVAQEPIRVETNQVLVPVSVLDKQQQQFYPAQLLGFRLFEALKAGDMKRFDALTEQTTIPDLTALDFRLYDDGKEQKIQSVSRVATLYWDLRDNKGHHTEYIGVGGGKWSTTQWQPELAGDSFNPVHYVIGYALPKSPEGSCHKIQVKVNRRNALVASREEYCNTHHPASDPLNGSKLGAFLESELSRPTEKGFELSVLAIPYDQDRKAARVHIAVDWHGKSIKDQSKPNGILGMISKPDGTLAARFSDLADRNGGLVHSLFLLSSPGATESNDPNQLPDENRYETQVNLLPGEYELRVVLGDGKRFGRAIVPLRIEEPNHEKLGISQMSVCKLVSDVSANAQKLPGAWAAKLENYAPLVSNETEFNPTNNTRFKLGEPFYIYFEIYLPKEERNSEGAIKIEIRIIDLNNGTTISSPEPVSAKPYVKPSSSFIPIGRGIDIIKVPNGSYRIDVRGVSSNGGSTPWSGENFTVE